MATREKWITRRRNPIAIRANCIKVWRSCTPTSRRRPKTGRRLTLLRVDVSRVILGDILRAHVAHSAHHSRVQLRGRGHHGRVRDKGRQVGVGRRRSMVERWVAARVEVGLLWQHQHPPHSVLLNDLKGDDAVLTWASCNDMTRLFEVLVVFGHHVAFVHIRCRKSRNQNVFVHPLMHTTSCWTTC